MLNSSDTKPAYWLQADLSTVEKIRQFETTPLSQRGLPTNTYDFLRQSSVYNPDQVAIHYFSDPETCDVQRVAITFHELMRKVNQTANLLHSLGVTKDQVIPMLLANTPEAQFALWGGQAAGIANPLNWMLEPEALANLIQSTNAKVLIAYGSDEYVNTWNKVQQLLACCPQITHVIHLGGNKQVAFEGSVQFVDYMQVIEQYPDNELVSGREFLADDIASIFATGGTTASPKLARHTHGNQVINAWLSALVAGMESGQSRLSATPLFHVVGAISGCLATLSRGGRLILPTSSGWRHPRLLSSFWKVIEALDVNITTIVPAIMNQLVRVPLQDHTITCLHTVVSGSAPVSAPIADQFAQLTGIQVREGYGMTESTSVIAMNPKDGIVKTGSIGLVFPYHRARIIPPASCHDSPKTPADMTGIQSAAHGLLALSGPCIFPGYVDSSFDHDLWIDDAWLNTGDWARIDEDGYAWIVGRQKDLIVRGGHNIDPKAMEDVLHTHPDVLEAAVVARPDTYAGEVPIAYVCLKQGSALTPSQLIQYARQRAGEQAAVPKDCYLLTTLPKSSVGKILKNTLRADATVKAFEHVLQLAGLGEDCVVSAQTQQHFNVTCHVAIRKPSLYEDVQQALLNFTLPYRIEVIPNDKPRSSLSE